MRARMRKTAAAAAVATVALTGLAAVPASAENIGNQGCTPGYWKNHTSVWDDDNDPGIGDEPYRPTLTLYWALYHQGSAFEGAPAAVAKFQDLTMLQALQGGGGPGLEGAAKILLRAATAAYLNASHEGLGYPLRRNEAGGLFDQVKAALTSGNRQQMLDLASKLDDLNNLGCPL